MQRTTWARARDQIKKSPAVLVAALAFVLLGAAAVTAATGNSTTTIACPDGADLNVHPGGSWDCGAAPSPSTSPTPTPTGSPSPSPSPSPTSSPTPSPSVTQSSSPSPSPTTTSPSPTPSPTGTTGCPVAGSGIPGGRDPWGGCFPGPGNTGVPSGTVLHSCGLNITAAGTYDACQFNGTLNIYAKSVVITRSLIKGQVYLPNEGAGTAGLVISDTTIVCGCPATSSFTYSAIMGSNFTLRRVDLSGSGHGVASSSNNVIQDSWIHGLGANNDAHKDGIYVGDGSNTVIRHNSIECNDGSAGGCTAAIGLLSDFSVISGYVIDRNLLNTNGSYCLYGGANREPGGPIVKPYSANHITVTQNVFGRAIYPKCGYYGPVDYFDAPTAANGNVFSGNVWVTGEPVTL